MLRGYRPADAEALAAVYRDAARRLGRQAYSETQSQAWALYPESIDEFRERLANGVTLCAIAGNVPVAFAQLDPVDHVAFLYCHSAHARRGYGSALLAALERHAVAKGVRRLQVEASAVARPFFERRGFEVVGEEQPIRHGVAFHRFRMVKALTAA